MISFVIPVFNERESLSTLLDELSRAVESNGLGEAEFIFVDDGSRDGSWSVLKGLSARDARVKAIRFRRNFGKAAALTAGFGEAAGDVVFTLDADLQDDPAEIPNFLARLGEGDGLDVVSGWKRTRHDPWHKVLPSRVFNRMVSGMTGAHLHDHNCGFKCYRSEVLREVFIYGELHRFVPVLAHARGFRVGEVEVKHRARRFGRSKYGFSRFAKGFLDLMTVRFLTRYGQRPQHLLGVAGLVLFSIGAAVMGYLAVAWVVDHWIRGEDHPIGTRPLLIYSTALLGVGTQLICLGVLAELITSYNLRAEDTYSVAERVGQDPGAGAGDGVAGRSGRDPASRPR
ncbi:glycosyltransferase family 2 protein [Tautonia plasticadhaerens]|uniref:Undecaprenyl-phosphate 4-deoxy-4-formamido-L-arabinose transferase n=1 Tax=Tautonia plasticadhaerens TaxID=2527974 RepID=A0A518HCP1_9BACT|nr:glycosyltransferase family 2 protein [Tautonia plasticadhaerens]QDV38629.1 Undecaprenyl-phosphate 4-deoxy-4-formamido-L-arabinose transferase [Tautonia plasticadhaerens]